VNESSPTPPQPYSHRIRVAGQIGDARETLAAGQETPGCEGMARYTGKLEALLKMVCDSAEHVLDSAS